jgi:hypothetical protein
MLFSIIYSVDVPRDASVRPYAPPQSRGAWDLTEGDSEYEYGYLGGRWKKGKHRKWCAVLNRKQFDAFVSHCGLVAEDVETLGSLGAPGFGVGWAPAISFHSDDEDAMQSAYVTPLLDRLKKPADERAWERVRKAVISVYG